LRTVPKEKLLSFYAHVGEFSKVLIEGGHWEVNVARYMGRTELDIRQWLVRQLKESLSASTTD
jgi:hypothetical protein